MLEQLTKEWTVPIYAFFKPIPLIDYVEGHHHHLFQCAASINQELSTDHLEVYHIVMGM
jgi:hypothetical protein